jgi:hypothetical protein
MSKLKKSSDHRKLMDRLAPDPLHGRLLGILATTYEMQPEFFETDFLPTLLGLGAWDDRNWTSRIALEKHLAELEAATVLLDARPYRGRPRSLRVEVQPVPLKSGRILHAKVMLSVHEKAVRLIVGSANLTEPGYRRNCEVVAVLTASANRPAEAKLITDAIRGFDGLLSNWKTTSASELCEIAKKRLAEWQGDLDVDDEWFVWGGGDTPLWKQVLDRWPKNDTVRRITVVSPFWSEERQGGPVATFVSALKSADSLADDAELRLLTEAAPDKQATCKPKLPETFRDFDAQSIGIRAYALAVDPRVPPEEVGMGDEFTGTRALHAKVVLLEGDDTSLAFFGSANFTNRGWGFRADSHRANIEAGIVLRRSGANRAALNNLLPATTGKPVPLAGAAAGRLALPDPSPDELPWPAFLREVVLSPSEVDADVLELVAVVDGDGVNGFWEITYLPSDDQAGQIILSVAADETNKSSHRVTLDQQSLARMLKEQEVHIRWWECPEGRSFPINVTAAARTALPISPGTGRPAEQHLIAYYQGRITWEDLFPDPDGSNTISHNGVDDDDPSGVDTSRIQSYIVRELVEALKGINDDLKAAAHSSKACMRLALLGSVSPIALARHVLEAADSDERTPTATGFQLVEILGCLDAARSYDASPLFQDDWLVLVDEAAAKVAAMLEKLQSRFPDDLSRDFRRYAKTVQKHHLAGKR